MDPLSRKLFQNSAARKRLAQMGGIMASSPALAKTVAKFQVGGSVGDLTYVVVIPGVTDRRGMRVNGDTLERLSREQPQLMQQSRVMDAESARQEGINVEALRPGDAILERRLLRPAAPPVETPVETPVSDGRSWGQRNIGDPLRAFFSPVGESARDVLGPVGESARDVLGPVGSDVRAQMRGEIPIQPFSSAIGLDQLLTPAEEVGLNVDQPSPRGLPIPYAPEGWTPDPFVTGERVYVPPAPTPETAADLRLAAASARNIGDQTLAEQLAAEAEAAAAAAAAAAEAEAAAAAEAEAARSRPSDEAAPVERPEPTEVERPPEETPPPNGGSGDNDPLAAAAGQVETDLRTFFGIEPPSRAPSSRRERVNQELELIREVFGDRTRDQARDRAMHLAMIGLAIAAGQSPNALTNIAQGALAGTQAMARAQQAQEERENSMRMEAYRNVLGEEREGRALGREVQMANFRNELQRRLIEYRASLGAGGLTDEERSRQEILYNDVFREALRTARETVDELTPALLQEAQRLAAMAAPAAPSAQRQLQGTQGAGQGGAPDPAVVQFIATQRAQNPAMTDAQVRAGLISRGYDPALYGL
jgi:hypothetical protein